MRTLDSKAWTALFPKERDKLLEEIIAHPGTKVGFADVPKDTLRDLFDTWVTQGMVEVEIDDGGAFSAINPLLDGAQIVRACLSA